MATKIDHRLEGLQALASMISDAYRRHRIKGIKLSDLPEVPDSVVISRDEIIAGYEPSDSGKGYVYTETVSVDHFLRNKKKRGCNEKRNNTD